MASIFSRIISKEIPAKIFHETDTVIVIADINPRDVVHLLIIPKKEYANFYQTPADVLSELTQTAKQIARQLGIEDHFRLQINNGYGQEVDHVHVHFLSNRGAERLNYQ